MKTFSSKDIINRLKIALDIKTDNDLSERLTINKSTLSNWKNRNTLDFDLVFSICEHINIDWLLTGDGNMLKPSKQQSQVEVKPIHHPKSVERKLEEQEVYLYDFVASAGLRDMLDNNRANIIDTIRIPNLPKCDGAIHIVGDSMFPLLKSGDIILYKEMPIDISYLFYGEMYLLSYLIDGDPYVVVKYVKKSDAGEPFVCLSSENPDYADRDIDFRSVNALALIKASVRINSMM